MKHSIISFNHPIQTGETSSTLPFHKAITKTSSSKRNFTTAVLTVGRNALKMSLRLMELTLTSVGYIVLGIHVLLIGGVLLLFGINSFSNDKEMATS